MKDQNTNSNENKNQEETPWDRTFTDDRDESGNLSRVRARKMKSNKNLYYFIILAALVLAIFIPLVIGAISNNASKKIIMQAAK